MLCALFLLIHFTNTAHIYSGPITVTYPYQGKAKQFILTFALDSGLEAKEYIKVAFPFPIHGSAPSAVLQKFYVVSADTNTQWNPEQTMEAGVADLVLLGNTTSQTISDNIYTFQYEVPLQNHTWYQLVINATSTTAQTSGVKYPIKMSTVSSLNSNAIIYDENPSYGELALNDLPEQTIILKSNYTIGSVGQSQNLTLNITPSISVGEAQNFLIVIDNYYQFIKLDDNNICEVSQCSCTLKSTQELNLICENDMANKIITVTINVLNSPILYSTTQSTNIMVYSIRDSYFLEYGQLLNILQLSKLQITVKYYLLWGVQMDNDLVVLYKAASANPKGYVFNNIKISFQLNNDIPNNEHLVSVSTGECDSIPELSITHNLGSGVICYFRQSSTVINCKQVQQLLKSTEYYVTFKCSLKNSALSPQSNFGRVTIKSVVRDKSPYSTYIIAGPTGSDVIVRPSEEFIDPAIQGLPNFGYNYLGSADVVGALSTIYSPSNGMTVGMKVGVQRIIFYLKVLGTQMCPTVKSYCGTGKTPEIYMKIMFNKNNFKVASTTQLEMSGSCGSPCTSEVKNYTTTEENYMLLKCSKSYDTCAALLSGSKGLAINGEILGQTTLYPSNKTLDFVVAFYEGIAGTAEKDASLVSVQLMQGYILNYDTPTIKASYINFYATSTQKNTGTVMPTMLRVLGKMNNPAQHLGIILDEAVEFVQANQTYTILESDDSGSTAPTQTIKCSIKNCYWYPHHGSTHSYVDAYINQRILLFQDFDGNSDFDVLVTLVNNPTLPKSIVAVSLSYNANNNGYDITNAVRIFGAAFQISNIGSSKSYYDSYGILLANTVWDGVSNWNSLKASGNVVGNYKVKDASLLKTGQAVNIEIQSEHTDSSNIISTNAQPLWGCGFTISKIESFTPTFTGGTCVTFADIIFCPYDLSAYNDNNVGNVVTGSLIVSAKMGAGYAIPFKYAWSTQQGNMAAFMAETQTLSSTAMKTGCAVGNWDGIIPNTKRQPITYTITPQLTYNLPASEIIQIKLVLTALPTGISIITYCIPVSLESNFSCSLSGSGTLLIFSLTALQTSVIEQGKALQIKFFLSHSGADKSQQTFIATMLMSTFTVEKCDGTGILSFIDKTTESQLLVDNYKLQNYNYYTKSILSLSFQLNNRTMLEGTGFQISLGFLGPSNSQLFSSQNARCLFYQNNEISRHWQYLKHENKILYFAKKSQYLLNEGKYTIQCKNIRNPDGSLTDPMIVSWIDLQNSNSAIQSNSISFNSLMLLNYFKTELTVKKYFNAPGFGSYYVFNYTPSLTNLTYQGRLYIEFSSAIQVKIKDIECYINDVKVYCYQELERRISIQPILSSINRMKPNILYTIRVGPVRQARGMDSYANIWIASDLDNNQTNGYAEHGYLIDPSIQGNLPSLIPKIAISFTSQNSRMSKTYMKINITAPIRAINTDKLLYIALPIELSVPQIRSNYQIECRLQRINDTTKKNYTSACQYQFNRLIQIQLLYDSKNARQQIDYLLELRSIYTPDWVTYNSLNKYFQSKIEIYFTDLTMEQVLFTGPQLLQYLPNKQLIFTPATTQQQLQWYIYDSSTNTYTKLIPILGFTDYPLFTVYRNIYKNQYLFLGLDDPNSRFQRQVQLSFTTDQFIIYGQNQIIYDLSTYSNFKSTTSQVVDPNPDLDPTIAQYQIDKLLNQTQNIVIEVGDVGYWFQIAAQNSIGSGLYYLNFDLTISDERTTYTTSYSFQDFSKLPFYTIVPIVAINVVTTECKLTLQGNSGVPVGGESTPIQLLSPCIPITEVIITPVVKHPLQDINPIIISKKASQGFKIGNPFENLQYYFIFKAHSDVSVGTTQLVNFTISGNDQFIIDSYALTITSNVESQELTLTTSFNSAINGIEATCSKDGTMYYSVSANGLTQWDTRSLISDQFNLYGNLEDLFLSYYYNPLIQYLQYYNQFGASQPTDLSALYSREVLFGMIGDKRISKMAPVTRSSKKVIRITQAQSNRQVQIYCKDQYNKISDIYTQVIDQDIVYKNHTLITLEFTREISVNQINNLICTFRELLQLNRQHILNQQCQQCNMNLLNYTKKSWEEILALNETVYGILNQPLISSSSNYKLYLYLNNFKFNNGQSLVMNDYFTKIVNSSSTNSTFSDNSLIWGRKLVNTTVDPEITYLFQYLSIQNYTEIAYSEVQDQVKVTANITNNMLFMNISKPDNYFAFLGINSDQLQLDFSNPLNLRQGISGNGIALEKSYFIQSETQLSYQINTNNKKYFIQYSSAPILGNCLASSYQDTQLIVLEVVNDQNTFETLIKLVFMIILIII